MGKERSKSSCERRASAENVDDAENDSDNESREIEQLHERSSRRRASAQKPDDAENDSDNDSDDASKNIEEHKKKRRKIEEEEKKKLEENRRKIEEQMTKLEEKRKAARMAKILGERDEEETEGDSGHGGKDLAGLEVRHGFDEATTPKLKGRRVLRGNGVKSSVKSDVNELAFPIYVADEDEDFYRCIDGALPSPKNSSRGAESVVALLGSLQHEIVSSNQPPAEIESQEVRLVLTATGEFCRSLQLDEVEALLEETEEGTSEEEAGHTKIVEVEGKHPVGEKNRGDPVQKSIEEVLIGRGLGHALSLLRQRGTLTETVDWGGRNVDKKRSKLVGVVDKPNDKIGQRDIVLERVDEFGRTMTPKEAFRKISHTFHGKGPGKMKQEKRIKQFHDEVRLKQMNSGDTPLLSMEKIREAQARMHTPFIVLSGNIKPGQISDPRSGFGTVEEEPPGSLTPTLGEMSAGSFTSMLGDKKVELFLETQRNSDAECKDPPQKHKELRLKRMVSDDTPLLSSHPRSGFGTVEKEPTSGLTPTLGEMSAGSLTPMVSDKVEMRQNSDSACKDAPRKQSNGKIGKRGILLDRVDEFGRTKEAFRQISLKFRGKAPPKMKRENRLKQVPKEFRLEQMDSDDTPLL